MSKKIINSIFAWIPEYKRFISVTEGTGDNLLDEDIEEGYVDYVMIDVYRYEDLELICEDGGQLMLSEPFENEYGDDGGAERLIKDAVDFMLNGKSADNYVIIETKEREVM